MYKESLLNKEVTPGDNASTDRPVKSETDSLEQMSNRGCKWFTRRRSTQESDVMDCILELPMSRAKDIHHKGTEGYLLFPQSV
jgi:hypothetical protein